MPEIAIHPQDAAYVALLADVERAFQSADGPARKRIFADTAKLFLKHAGKLGSDSVTLFGEVFLRQIDGISEQALASFSAPLAPIPQAPQKLMRQLARHENPAVATPVLIQSAALDPADVMAIAKSCGNEHLLAISQRADVPADLAAVLIARGDQKTIDTLAKNPGAKYRVGDFGDMLGRATCDERARVITRMPVAVRNAETGPAAFTCMMVDISPGGAKLQFTAPVPLPATFIFELTNVEKKQVPCRTIWQRDNIAGLLFTSSLLALWGATAVPMTAPRPVPSR
jgi:hypothetical protein